MIFGWDFDSETTWPVGRLAQLLYQLQIDLFQKQLQCGSFHVRSSWIPIWNCTPNLIERITIYVWSCRC